MRSSPARVNDWYHLRLLVSALRISSTASGSWSGAAPSQFRSLWPIERFRTLGWVGVTVHSTSVVNQFVNAYAGLDDWDALHDPQALDGLLLPGEGRPQGAKLRGHCAP